jgi:hypothetical protein
MKVEQNDVLLAVAKLVRSYGITIDEFYGFLGVDLENYRVDADYEVSQLAGIFQGWSNPGDNE